MERSFEEDIRVNKYKLDEECSEQANLYRHWGEELAEAKAEKDKMEDRLKLTLAQVEMQIRSGEIPVEGKITEAVVKAVIESQDDVLAARKEVRKAKKQVYTLEVAVTALEHRKRALDNITQLYIKSYFARPDGGPIETINDEYSSDVRGNLNKKRSKNSGEEKEKE